MDNEPSTSGQTPSKRSGDGRTSARDRYAAYADAQYWDGRYKRQPLEFEWFYGWQALRRTIRAHLPKRKALLQIGCGNSNLQQKMAESGFCVTNVDISPVVIEQMQARDVHLPTLEYVVADCRDLHMFRPFQFWGAFDKGTIDALMCCKEGAENVTRMCVEISRVLRPGATFLAISLGEPSQRTELLTQPAFHWDVSVLLLPRLPPEQMVHAPDRCLPVNDTLAPLDPLGPYAIGPGDRIESLPQPFDPSKYFYVYVCKKPNLELQLSSKQKVRLPAEWRQATQEAINKLKDAGALRSKSTRSVSMRRFLADQESALGSEQDEQSPNHSRRFLNSRRPSLPLHTNSSLTTSSCITDTGISNTSSLLGDGTPLGHLSHSQSTYEYSVSRDKDGQLWKGHAQN